MLDADEHAVAVHRLHEVHARDVEVARDVLDGVIGLDEAEAVRVHREAPGDQVHAVGQAVVPAARLDEGATRDEAFQGAAQSDALLARHAQHTA